MTTREVCQLLRLSPTRVQELVAADVLRPIRLTARGNFRFRRDEIEALIAPPPASEAER